MSIFKGRIPLQGGMQAIALAARLIGCGLSSTGRFLLVPDGTSCTLSPFVRRAFARAAWLYFQVFTDVLTTIPPKLLENQK